MAAVEAPPVAEPVTEAPPTPEAAPIDAPAEGDAAPGTEGDVKDYSAVEAELEAEVERRVQERASKAEEAAARKGLQRTKEADDGEAARTKLWATAKAAAQQSGSTLRQLAQSGELDDNTLDQHMDTVIAGVHAFAAEANETTLKAFTEAVLPDMTEAETETLEPLLYDFRRNGRFDKLPITVAQLAIDRKDAEIADLKKQIKDRGAITAAAQKLSEMGEAAGPGVGSETPKGKASADMTYEQLLKLPQAEQQAFITKNPDKFDRMIGVKK